MCCRNVYPSLKLYVTSHTNERGGNPVYGEIYFPITLKKSRKEKDHVSNSKKNSDHSLEKKILNLPHIP